MQEKVTYIENETEVNLHSLFIFLAYIFFIIDYYYLHNT